MRRRARIAEIEIGDDEADIVLNEFEIRAGKREANKLFKKIEYIISTAGLLNIDTAINKKSELIIKYEDRLFLNPLSKVRAIPRKQDKPKQTEMEKEFGL
jgi:hypothetical protein